MTAPKARGLQPTPRRKPTPSRHAGSDARGKVRGEWQRASGRRGAFCAIAPALARAIAARSGAFAAGRKSCGGTMMENTNPDRDFYAHGGFRARLAVLRLQFNPKSRLHVEKQTEPQSRISGDRTISMHQITDPAGGDVNVCRQLARRYSQRLHEVLQQDFARVDCVE